MSEVRSSPGPAPLTQWSRRSGDAGMHMDSLPDRAILFTLDGNHIMYFECLFLIFTFSYHTSVCD